MEAVVCVLGGGAVDRRRRVQTGAPPTRGFADRSPAHTWLPRCSVVQPASLRTLLGLGTTVCNWGNH